MGHRVGQAMIDRFTKDSPRFKDELDIMKFICKDFWTAIFKKQVDNLRTNHQVWLNETARVYFRVWTCPHVL